MERDKAVLDAIAANVKTDDCACVEYAHECDVLRFDAKQYADYTIIHMTRSKEALEKLLEMERAGATVINNPASVLGCNRRRIEAAMISCGLLTPAKLVEQNPELQDKGWWIKSADTTDSSENHIRFCQHSEQVSQYTGDRAEDEFLIQPHIEGINIKFYGVLGTDFFYVKEDVSKEVHASLHNNATVLAQSLGISIYGGDAILTHDNKLTIIDFNDFPSFSVCRDEVAEAIKIILTTY